MSSWPEESSPDADNALFNEKTVPRAKIMSIKFDMMTCAEMTKSSSFNAVKGSDLVHQKMGLPNPTGECSSCGGSSLKQCDGHVGIIKLPQTIYHPFYVGEIAQILNQICLICKYPMKGRGKKSCSRISPKHLLDDQKSCKFCSTRVFAKKWKFKVLKDKSSMEIYAEIKTRDLKTGSVPSVINVVLSPPQVFELLKDIDPGFVEQYVSRRELLFLSYIPVLPNCSRVTERRAEDSSFKLTFDERTRAYKRLVNQKVNISENQENDTDVSGMVLECLSLAKVGSLPRTSMLIPQTLISSGFINFQLRPSKSPSKPTSSNVSGLKWVKEVVLSKRTDNVCRMTVIGDPNIMLSELGIPDTISKHLSIPESITRYNKSVWDKRMDKLKVMDIEVRRDNIVCSVAEIDHLQEGDILLRPVEDGDVLLINRPPSVHQHSLIALSARILPTESVFSMNPLLCAPLCGDFDGDCLHAFVPQSMHSRVELKELVHLSKQLINGQDGKALMSLNQDSLTASYILLRDVIFLSKAEVQLLGMSSKRTIPIPAIIKAPLQGPLWTGQQLFDTMLPEGLESSLSSISSCLENTRDGLFTKILQCYGEKALEYFSSAQEMLCEWISKRGFSVSIEDMYVTYDVFDRKKLIQEVEEGLREAEHAFRMNNFLSNPNFVYSKGEEFSSYVMNPRSFAASKEVFEELQYLIRGFSRKGNSMLTMIKSGSKGSLSKFLQQSACLGLQYSAVSLEVPCRLSRGNSTLACGSCAMIRGSFIEGLNPLEFFLHSKSGRGNLFSENAEVPGTLTRRLMFYMRDLKLENDGTVRSSFGQKIVKFSCDDQGGHPVGSLAACSISEAAYSALDQPSYLFEASPLSCLKKAFECGEKRNASSRSISLALSPKLRRWDYGYEYAALRLKEHLERVFFSDIISTVLICYAGKDAKAGESPWVAHFHVDKVRPIKCMVTYDDLRTSFGPRCISPHYGLLSSRAFSRVRPSRNLIPQERISKKGMNAEMIRDAVLREHPGLHSTRCCLCDGGENCIAIAAENSKYPADLDYTRHTMIPLLLQTVIRGYVEVKRVEIKWDDQFPSGLFLKVVLSGSSKRGNGWNFLLNACLPMMNLIDWHHSHPDDISDASKVFGVHSAWKYFVSNLKAATVKIRKQVHVEHLHLIADSLSATGQFLPLTSRGLILQRDQESLSSPFLQAFFSCPEKNFVRAAKKGEVDRLLGVVESIAWGREPPVGTGGPFKLMFKPPGVDLPEGVYQNLVQGFPAKEKVHEGQNANDPERAASNGFVCCRAIPDPDNLELCSISEPFKVMLKTPGVDQTLTQGFPAKQKVHEDQNANNPERAASAEFVRCGAIPDPDSLKASLQEILHKNPNGACLNEEEKSIVVKALEFHPNRDAKIGVGIKEIKIGHNPEFRHSRCFVAERTDSTSEDFSYRKCVNGAKWAKRQECPDP